MTYRAGNSSIVLLIGMMVILPLVISTGYRTALTNLLFAILLLIPFCILVFVFTYLKIENGKLVYVNFLIQRESIDILAIDKIESGHNMLFYPRTYVYYRKDKTNKRLVIYNGFSRTTMQRILGDIKRLNPKIAIL